MINLFLKDNFLNDIIKFFVNISTNLNDYIIKILWILLIYIILRIVWFFLFKIKIIIRHEKKSLYKS